ncbi:SRPBCC family protein [Bacillus niameyensis]|uniref:SRPBCC family protein n=1 Tax=Bacillus niameyensis TaxID=1522308 RepID=UPI000782F9DC|nr:SRPBCC domain-containing protein [Bacillus niameyensis]
MADLSLDFQFKSSIHKVWDALTNSDTLSKWIMENNFKPIVGHKCQFWNEHINLIVNSEVLAVDKPNKLSYTWVGGPINTVVTWTLRQEDETTYLHLEQSEFKKVDYAFTGAKNGWAYMIEGLKEVLGEV